jgi:hypothetical protein
MAMEKRENLRMSKRRGSERLGGMWDVSHVFISSDYLPISFIRMRYALEPEIRNIRTFTAEVEKAPSFSNQSLSPPREMGRGNCGDDGI